MTSRKRRKIRRAGRGVVVAFERVTFWVTRIGVGWLVVTSAVWLFVLRDFYRIVVAELLIAVVVGTAAAVRWRRKRLKVLADSGNPDPGLVGLGRQFVDEREKVAYVRQQFELACKSNHLQDANSPQKAAPQLRHVRMDGNGDVTFTVDCAEAGLTVEDLQAKQHEIAQICRAHRCVIRKTKNVGWATVMLQKSDHLARVPPYQELARPKRRGNMVLGTTEHGTPLELHSHIPTIFAGGQGSGKSNLGRAALLSLADQGIFVKLRIINPKNQEFAEWGKHVGEWVGTFFVAGYVADDVPAGLRLLDEAYAELQERSERFAAQGITNAIDVPNSKDNPYLLVINDEGLDYSEAEKKGSTISYGRFKQKARSVGAQAITMFQYCLATELGAGRKLYGQRICMRAEEETGITVLGRSAVTRGAKVDRIPIDKPGLGVYVDESDQVTWFRSAYVPDSVWHDLANGIVPDDMGAGLVVDAPEEDHAVYIFATADSEVLYVGRARDPKERAKDHAKDKPWFGDIDWSNPMTKVLWRPGLAAAVKCEKQKIRELQPRYNSQHNMDNPLRRDWRKPRPPAKTVTVPLPAPVLNVTPITRNRNRPPTARTRRVS